MIVCAGVWILRVREPDLPRPFKTPFVPVVPILGILVSLRAHDGAARLTLVRSASCWMAIGLVVYFAYSRHRSSRISWRCRRPAS